jgi:steroid delta-isomerase-like uncharacterized protein
MEIPQIVRTYIDTFCRGDLDAWLATFAPAGTCSDSGTPQPLSGPAIKDHYAGLFAGFLDLAIETVALLAITSDLAVWRWVVRGTNTGTYRGFPPTGRSLILPGCEFIEVRDGLMQRVEGYFDRLSILQQLGLMSRPAAESAS